MSIRRLLGLPVLIFMTTWATVVHAQKQMTIYRNDGSGTQTYSLSDLGTDFLGRTTENNLKCAWLSNKSSINLNGDHSLSFGHYIRCIRK